MDSDFMMIIKTLLQILLYSLAIKSILGVHFPWEKCQCCGKKWSEHDKVCENHEEK